MQGKERPPAPQGLRTGGGAASGGWQNSPPPASHPNRNHRSGRSGRRASRREARADGIGHPAAFGRRPPGVGGCARSGPPWSEGLASGSMGAEVGAPHPPGVVAPVPARAPANPRRRPATSRACPPPNGPGRRNRRGCRCATPTPATPTTHGSSRRCRWRRQASSHHLRPCGRWPPWLGRPYPAPTHGWTRHSYPDCRSGQLILRAAAHCGKQDSTVWPGAARPTRDRWASRDGAGP